MIHTATPPERARLDALDALRGLAMLWMTVYHFCFDLNYFGYWSQDFYGNPLWTWQRSLILSLFLVCAGIGQAAAAAQGQSWARFWRRWMQVAGCALLVTFGSWWLFPQSYIYFGVLHGLAVMLVIARLTARWGRALGWAGLAALAIGLLAPSLLGLAPMAPWADRLNQPGFNWLGLVTHKPVTEDYVPLFPWLGVLWLGMAAGAWLSGRGARQRLIPLRWLVAMGRWSLSYYMLHQPVLMGLLFAYGWLRN